jgi:hypothetical protein
MPIEGLKEFVAVFGPTGGLIIWIILREVKKPAADDPVKRLTDAMSELRNRVSDQATEIAVIRAILDRMEKRDRE